MFVSFSAMTWLVDERNCMASCRQEIYATHPRRFSCGTSTERKLSGNWLTQICL